MSKEGFQDEEKLFFSGSHQTDPLVAKVRSLETRVHVLIALYAFLLVLYISSTGYVVYTLLSVNQHSSHISSDSPPLSLNGRQGRYCLGKNDFLRFQDAFNGVDHYSSNDVECFKDLTWIPRVLNLVYTRLEERINYLDEQVLAFQTNLTENSSDHLVGFPIGQQFGAGYSYRPFAHLFWDVIAQYPEKTANAPLKWVKSGIDGSSMRGMTIDPESRELKIRQPGYYFIYSHVMYKMNNEETTARSHTVFKNFRDNSGKVKLLESGADNKGPTSFLQGIFLLHANETLTVCAPINKLYNDTGRFIYMGAYLV